MIVFKEQVISIVIDLVKVVLNKASQYLELNTLF